ncbi:ATP-dependent DNA ligase [Streptomyces sp. HMX87]|uniref:ATP-dependent DNA ligase n=1 Tax=Streptomyces sp. HMX87 TaxID=3390849 RepID=UPI003A89F4FC
MQSRNRKDFTAAFPELADAARSLGEDVVLDGEAVIYRQGRLQFAALQQRINRRPSTTARLAREQPAHLIAFDLLHRDGTDLITRPYTERRAALESLFRDHSLGAPWTLTPVPRETGQAQAWMRQWAPAGVEGVVAKGQTQPYRPGHRGWLKYRHRVTAEGIVGAVTGSLNRPETALLGRYTPDGDFQPIARSTPLPAPLARELTSLLTPAGTGHPWHGMRVSTRRGSRDPLTFTPTAPELVMEFYGDAAADRGRWRHPVRAHRIRRDLTSSDVPVRAAEPDNGHPVPHERF